MKHTSSIVGLIFILIFSFSNILHAGADGVTFQNNVKKYFTQSSTITVNNKMIEKYASQLMLIKNGMSLYRDGDLNNMQVDLLKKVVNQHLKFGSMAISSLGPQKYRTLAEQIHYNALASSEILKMKRGSPEFKTAINKYHTSVGYNAYTKAQDLGVEQDYDY